MANKMFKGFPMPPRAKITLPSDERREALALVNDLYTTATGAILVGSNTSPQRLMRHHYSNNTVRGDRAQLSKLANILARGERPALQALKLVLRWHGQILQARSRKDADAFWKALRTYYKALEGLSTLI